MLKIFLIKLSRKNKKKLFGLCLLLSDLFFLVIAALLSLYIRFYTTFFGSFKPSYNIDRYYLLSSLLFVAMNLIIFGFYGLFDNDQMFKGSGYYLRIFKSISINLLIIVLIGYLIQTYTFSRIWIFSLYILSLIFLYLSRYFIEILTQKIVINLNLSSKTIIIGIGENEKRIEDTLKKNLTGIFNIIGYVEKEEKIHEDINYSKNFLILGYLDNLREILLKHGVNNVIISSKTYKYFEILNILENLKGLDVLVLMSPGLFEFSVRRMRTRDIGGIPLFQISDVGFFGINLFYKNLIDYLLGCILFLFFIPLYLVLGLLIKLDSKGPIFFKQKRYTKNFREFYIYKFRTMFLDAEERLEELKKFNQADGLLFKIKDDPRITKIGRFLRETSLDELPQIINVMKGELSFVGPRPIPVKIEEFEDWQKKRFNVKQGITGLWQVSGRSNLNFEEMIRLDLYYIQNWSIIMDIKILLKTFSIVFLRKGAY
jgi:exopolysaccharide biosynthesis polyprenyl glycosylphosphotransferase